MMTSPRARLGLSVAALVFFFAVVCGQNVTLDDTDPTLTWTNCLAGPGASKCTSESTTSGGTEDCPNVKLLLNQTWRDCHANSGASLQFTFTGTAFYVFGMFPNFQLWNNNEFVPVLLIVDGVESLGDDLSGTTAHKPNVSYAQMTSLEYGLHTVHVLPGTPLAGTDTYILLDYVVIDTSPTTTSISASSESSAPATSPALAATTSPSSTSDPNPISAGTIAGAVVGSIFGALAIFALIFLVIKRRRLNNSHVGELPPGRQSRYVVDPGHEPSSDNAVSEAHSEPPPYMIQVTPFTGTNDQQPSSYSAFNSDSASSGPSVSSRDALSIFAESHRDVIPPELESKLRQAGYQPHLNPDMVSNEVWSQAGVGPFSLQILREIYQSSHPLVSLTKRP